MTTPPPALPFTWDGDAMVPLARFRLACDRHFTVGEVYPLEVREDRSAASHRQYFAAINEAFANLPEDDERFASADHLRRWALIKAGFRDERSIACASKAEAQRVAAFVRPMDDYAVVVVRDALVVVYTAKSQSVRAMGREEFQRSKDAVMGIVAELIGTTRDALAQAGRAA